MNEFVFTSMRRVFVRFLEEIEDTKKTFRNYLIFTLGGITQRLLDVNDIQKLFKS